MRRFDLSFEEVNPDRAAFVKGIEGDGEVELVIEVDEQRFVTVLGGADGNVFRKGRFANAPFYDLEGHALLFDILIAA